MAETFRLEQGIAEVIERIKSLEKEKPVVIIGIAGGSGAGKGHTAFLLTKKLKGKIFSMDDYYRGLQHIKDMNFDTPEALDLGLLKEHIALLKQGRTISKPIYDFKTHTRIGEEDYSPSKLIMIEGLFALNDIIRDELDLAIFIDSSEDTRLKRRIERDIVERHRTEESVLKQWKETVKPMHDLHVEPQKEHADIIISNE